MTRLEGKVAFVTGAARGQGRAHAVRLAEEGAHIIAIDLCSEIPSLRYEMPGSHDLQETVRLVEKTGRRIIATQVDVRDADALRNAVAAGVGEFGGLHIVVANAGVLGLAGNPPLDAWADVLDINLTGALNTIHATLTFLEPGASIIAIGSLSALVASMNNNSPGVDLGHSAYILAKRLLAQYVHELARQLAPRSIRVNIVHPTNCDTPMLQNDTMYRAFRPDLNHPTRDDAEPMFNVLHAMPVPHVAPADVSSAVAYLASDEARFVTGMQLRIDAGGYVKANDYTV
ncbi:mycofactocin-coupled SDR family oxidoreductase [Mycobacterium sp. EPa45]|uniref:mycofactocin-coupled SDR family oxidoreductase n=1 Tax=Mycobacterium sp. EPa45 TaxID=1545728 RepID=UPI0006426872|nr:mycofactocin-coupled SDR family oxidoreductase [Mycobacterium sp. EPa45]AKK25494.1 3-ketoacyl-ACP reductase [Mycobacterium sp. EPa45]